MRTQFGPNGNQTTQDLIDSIRNRSDFPSVEEIETREPYQGFNKLMELNGYYWEPYGSVIQVAVQGRNLVIVTANNQLPRYMMLNHFRSWMNRMGYEKEDAHA